MAGLCLANNEVCEGQTTIATFSNFLEFQCSEACLQSQH